MDAVRMRGILFLLGLVVVAGIVLVGVPSVHGATGTCSCYPRICIDKDIDDNCYDPPPQVLSNDCGGKTPVCDNVDCANKASFAADLCDGSGIVGCQAWGTCDCSCECNSGQCETATGCYNDGQVHPSDSSLVCENGNWVANCADENDPCSESKPCCRSQDICAGTCIDSSDACDACSGGSTVVMVIAVQIR